MKILSTAMEDEFF